MHSRTELHRAIREYVFISDKTARIIDNDELSRRSWIFDFRALLLQPDWLSTYADMFWEHYASRYPFQVCGMESAAISLVTAIVMKSAEHGTPVNGLYVRKSRKRTGLLKQLEGTPNNNPVILVDDLINSGYTFDKQLKILKDAGLRVSDAFALLAFRGDDEYETLAAENIQLHTIFKLTDFDISAFTKKENHLQPDSLEVLWRFRAPHPSYNLVAQKSAPIIDGERVYFGSDAGIFYALDQQNGQVSWSFEIGRFPEGKGILSSPALSQHTIYFGAYDGNVYALDASTGSKKWIYDDADWVGSSPAIASDLGQLYIGLEFGLWGKRGGIVALDITTGEKKWEHHTSALTHGSPLYIREENMVIIGSNDATIYAYNARTGNSLWKYGIDGDVKSCFAYDPKRRSIFFGSLGGQFYAVSARDGVPLFSRETVGIYSTPLIYDDTVFFSSLDKNLHAIRADTGEELWEFPTSGRIFASPIIAENSLWIGSNDGRLYEIDPRTGTLKSMFQFSERIVNKIAYNPKTKKIFVPTQANEIYCLQRK